MKFYQFLGNQRRFDEDMFYEFRSSPITQSMGTFIGVFLCMMVEDSPSLPEGVKSTDATGHDRLGSLGWVCPIPTMQYLFDGTHATVTCMTLLST